MCIYSKTGGEEQTMHTRTVMLDGESLGLGDFLDVVYGRAKAELSCDAKRKMSDSRKHVESVVDESRVVYGITTGFGRFADVVISADETRELQQNLILSHACGTGPAFSEREVRGMMLLRANALAKGYSGVRIRVVDTLLKMLNEGIHPVIPQQGSVGASGDLAPLAHLVLVMIGRGKATHRGLTLSGDKALKQACIEPVVLEAKEGLALINGTQAMTSVGLLSLKAAQDFIDSADIVAGLTVEVLRGIPSAFDARLITLRPHQGAVESASRLCSALKGSRLTTSSGELRVQDAYSLRCTPQVHGATRAAIVHVHEVLRLEMNSATDNPLVVCNPDGTRDVISGGNFHGQPVSSAMDYLGLALLGSAGISERRIDRMLNPVSSGLPAFLTRRGGLNSGFMIAHYTAAALLSESKILASPASVDSIPVSASQEDHVSMGPIAARKARDIALNATKILAIELMCACQAADLLGPEMLGQVGAHTYKLVRKVVPALEQDREIHEDIEKVTQLLQAGELLAV